MSRVARRSCLAGLVLAIALATSAHARADEPAPAEVSASPPAVAGGQRRVQLEEETEWYGWQTLIADGTSVLILPIVAGVTQSPTLGGIAVGGYFLAPPIIHGAHGRWAMFAASLGLRVVMPVVGGLLGAAAEGDCGGDLCIPVGAAIGVAVGVLGAIALDASLLSYETVDADPRYRGRSRKPGDLAWSPTIAPRKEGGFTLGLGATF